jgi:Uma2 family endonuclease
MTTANLYKAINKLPNALAFVQDVQRVLEAERSRRLEYYNWLDNDKKAEFINGKIIMHSPDRLEHWETCTNVVTDLNVFVRRKKLGKVGAEKVTISLSRNDYQPDVVFFGNEKSMKFTEGQMLFPAPDLAVEILSKSTQKNDRGIKFIDYAAHGVAEYWIINVAEKTIELYTLIDTEYQLHRKYTENEVLQSVLLVGFEMPLKNVF